MEPQKDIVTRTEDYVKQVLAGNDASHDYFHIQRVVKTAIKLAEREGATDQLELITLAALLHDVHDYKYSGSESAGVEAVTQFLNEQNYPSHLIDQIVYIVKNLSFKNELAASASSAVEVKPEWIKSLHIVQDADRLDAIGAIGVARCMIFSGAKNRPMHDPSVKPNTNISKQEYMNKSKDNDTAINHFYEKLFKLKDLMRTESGRQIAESRDKFMHQFVDQLLLEWDSQDA